MKYETKGTQVKIYMPGVTYLHEIGVVDEDGYTLIRIYQSNYAIELLFIGEKDGVKLKDIMKTIGRVPYEIVQYTE